MSWRFRHSGLSHPGRVREKNEDRWTADAKHGIYVVADGMGGHFAGELAARTVVETLPQLLRERLRGTGGISSAKAEECVRDAVAELSNTLHEQARGEPGLDGMGATVVAVLVQENQALIVHMGDSRAYLYRQGLFEQLTRDHSVVQLLVDNEEIAPEEAGGHPAHGQITRYVGMDGEPLPETRVVELWDGDRLLLCTDGVTDMLGDEELRLVFQETSDAEAICQRLVEAANAAGGRDNVTIVVLETEHDSRSRP